jgi:hypothetical protein
MTKRTIAILLQAGGVVSASIGAGLAHPAAGFMVAGVGAVLFGVALERD